MASEGHLAMVVVGFEIVSSVLGQLETTITPENYLEGRLPEGAENELKKLRENLQEIRYVPADAEQKQGKEKPLRSWLNKLKNTCYDLEDVLDEWNIAVSKMQVPGADLNALIREKEKVCFMLPSSCSCLNGVSIHRDFARKIKELSEIIDDINKEKKKFSLKDIGRSDEKIESVSSSFDDVSEICFRDNEKKELVGKLCESGVKRKHPHIISVVGPEGVGKTTLAQFAYNDNMVLSYFDKRIWVRVSDPFDELKIAKSIIKALKGVVFNVVEIGSLLQWISLSVVGKKCLLVLDGMSVEDYEKWKPFYRCLKNGLPGTKILITTRKETIASMVELKEVVPIEKLPREGCLMLLKHLAFFDRSPEDWNYVEDIGEKIADKCKGLPFAVKIIGSLLRFKNTIEQWPKISESCIWELEELEANNHFPFLFLSYCDLPTMLKRCFSYCAIFPKDYNMSKDQLIKLWMAQGYLGLEKDEEMEMKGREYFDYLVRLSFFDVFKKDHDGTILCCKMQDIVHDFAQFINKFEYLTIEVNGLEDPFSNTAHQEAHHLMLMVREGAPLPKSLSDFKKLRSLIILCRVTDPSLLSDVLLKLFDQQIPLRALDLSAKLQAECGYQHQEVTSGDWKVNQLEASSNNGTSLEYMPRNREITCLQTLSDFFLGGGGSGGEACTLEILKRRKKRGVSQEEEEILVALQPPSDIEGLRITALGRLPSLESPPIWNMQSVKRVGNEFLGIEVVKHLLLSFRNWSRSNLLTWKMGRMLKMYGKVNNHAMSLLAIIFSVSELLTGPRLQLESALFLIEVVLSILMPTRQLRPNGADISAFILIMKQEIEIAGKRSNPERKWRPLLACF
ncbi:putative disease resistance protein RGA3 [Pistacia vera]|uniref:putative disease resistance protein RGA3 n=1 Tax=Pistacia vera TaxID=55513 RepID=UPI00126308AE|nr:putative disease resistance protein RGA3 [Pistacia vera]